MSDLEVRTGNALAIGALLLTLAGCSGGGGTNAPLPVTPLPQQPAAAPGPAPVAIGGSVVKGIVRNASVEVFAIIDGAVAETTLAEGTTDADGELVVEVPGDTSGLVLIRTFGDDDAEMRCDLPGGCRGVAFRDFVPVGPDFVLRTIVELTEGEPIDQDVSTFSDFAVADLLSAGGEITPEAVTAAKRRVADGFGLEGDLDDLEIIDIAGEGVDEASDASRAAGLLSAALLGVAFDEGGESFVTGLGRVRDSWSGLGGALVINDEDADEVAISLIDVLERASAALDDAGDSLPAALRTAIAARLAEARQREIGARTGGDGLVRPVVAASELARVKAFVGDLRTAIVAFDDPAFGGDLVDRIDQVSDELAPDARNIGALTLRILDAVVSAVQNVQRRHGGVPDLIQQASADDSPSTEDTPIEETPPLEFEIGGIVISNIVESEEGVSFTVEQTVDGFDVDLSGTVLPAEIVERIRIPICAQPVETLEHGGPSGTTEQDGPIDVARMGPGACEAPSTESEQLELTSEVSYSATISGSIENERLLATINESRIALSGSRTMRSTQLWQPVEAWVPVAQGENLVVALQAGETIELDFGLDDSLDRRPPASLARLFSEFLELFDLERAQTIEALQASVDLDVELEQVSSAEVPIPASFTGDLSVSISDSVLELFRQSCDSPLVMTRSLQGCFTYDNGTIAELGSADIALSGALTTAPGTDYTLSLASSIEASNGETFTLLGDPRRLQMVSGDDVMATLVQGSDALDGFDIEESEDNFLVLGATTLVLTGPVTGLGENVRVEVSASRDDFEAGEASLALSYGNVRIDLDAPEIPVDLDTLAVAELPVTLVNRRGVRMDLLIDLDASDKGEVVLVEDGRIALNRDDDEPGQAVVELREGLLVVVYEDDSFETLF